MIKELTEKRNALIEEMEGLLATAKTETRALNETETTRYEAIKTEIAGIDNTLKIENEVRNMDKKEAKKDNENIEDVEMRAFADFIRGTVTEQRADVNFAKGDNGAVIPSSIANKIIEKVKELSPILAMATKFNVKGTLSFPVYDESAQKVTCAYADEFTALTSTSGKFTNVDLKGYLAGALSKVSESLVNNSDFDLLSYVVNKMAEAISEFLEKELLVGTTNKMTGILSSANGVKAAAATAITADELIDLQMTVPEVYQTGACFIMNKSTFKAIRKLKDNDDNYLLNKDLTTQFGWSLLGKSVYVSENMPTMAANAKAIAYGDMSGLYVKFTGTVEVKVLREKYADEHAIGVLGWVEADSKIVEPQKIAVLTMAAA